MQASDFQHPQFESLIDSGLNLHSVLDLASLPPHIRAHLAALTPNFDAMHQVIVIGHGGGGMWQAITGARPLSASSDPDPIDRYTKRRVVEFFHGHRFHCLYPGSAPVNLQWFGEHAGWHHASPLRIGINPVWGTWFAYRALVIADTSFAPSARPPSQHPCSDCAAQPCMAACPVATAGADTIDLDACISYRLSDNSPCAHRCLARQACPVAPQHRYHPDQLAYHYRQSLAYLTDHRPGHRGSGATSRSPRAD